MPDELRALTPAGIAAAGLLAGRIAAAEVRPAVVLTSPLVRTRQTAEIVGTALGVPVLVDTRLAPGATATDLRAAVAGLDGPVVTIGHQPDCSHIVEELTGGSRPFPPATCIELEVEPETAA